MWRNWWIGHSVWSACRGVLDQQERKHAKHSITRILGMIGQILEELHWHCNFVSNFSRLFLPESFFQFFLEFASPSSSVSWGTALMRLSWSSVASLSCAPRSRPLRSGHTSWPVFHYITKIRSYQSFESLILPFFWYPGSNCTGMVPFSDDRRRISRVRSFWLSRQRDIPKFPNVPKNVNSGV